MINLKVTSYPDLKNNINIIGYIENERKTEEKQKLTVQVGVDNQYEEEVVKNGST